MALHCVYCVCPFKKEQFSRLMWLQFRKKTVSTRTAAMTAVYLYESVLYCCQNLSGAGFFDGTHTPTCIWHLVKIEGKKHLKSLPFMP